MKKALSVVLALILCCTMTMTALANSLTIRSPFPVNVDESVDDMSWTVADEGALTIQNAATLTIGEDGALIIQDGGSLTLLDGGALTIQEGGSLTIQEGGILTIQSGTTLTIQDGSTLTNNATIFIENGGVLSAPPGTDLGAIVNNGQVNYDSTQVSYQVSPTYSVTIPPSVTLGQTATISAKDVRVEKGKQVEVALTGTSDADNAFTLATAEGAEITYTVQDASKQAVSLNDTVLAVNPDTASSGSAVLSFIAPTAADITYAGTYTGTVTFTVSVEDAA